MAEEKTEPDSRGRYSDPGKYHLQMTFGSLTECPDVEV
jgi:hypothetical protein